MADLNPEQRRLFILQLALITAVIIIMIVFVGYRASPRRELPKPKSSSTWRGCGVTP